MTAPSPPKGRRLCRSHRCCQVTNRLRFGAPRTGPWPGSTIVPAAHPLLETTPDRAAELLAEPEARQGRTRWRKLRQVRNYWASSPRCFRASAFPTSPALIGRRHGFRSLDRPSMSDVFLKAALPPSCSRTGRCARLGVYPALRWSPFHPTTAPRLSGRCRSDGFDWPAGGTEEFLGRCSARSNSRHTEAKGAPADPPNVFGAVGRFGALGVVPLTQSVTARTEPRGAAVREWRSSREDTCAKP